MASKTPPGRPKIGQKCCTVVDFWGFRLSRKCLRKDGKMDPQGPQKEAKTAPKWARKRLQDGLKTAFENRRQKGPQKRPQDGPKGTQKGPKWAPRGAQDGPQKGAREGQKRGPERKPQNGFKMNPKRPKNDPKMTPKCAPRGPKNPETKRAFS